VGREGRHEPLGALAVDGRHGRADRRPLDGRGPEQAGGSRELRASERRRAEHFETTRDPEAVLEVRPDHEALAGQMLRLVEIAYPTVSCLRHNATTGETTVSMERFAFRPASNARAVTAQGREALARA
jgi:hypothetical protein